MKKILGLFLFPAIILAAHGHAAAAESEIRPVLSLSFDDERNPMKDAAGAHESLDTPENAKPKWVAEGKFGGALEFDGVDDFAVIKDAADLNFGDGDSFTVEFWVKIDPPDSQSVASIVQKNNDINCWDIRYHTERRLAFVQRLRGMIDQKTIMMKWGDASGKWRHAAFVRDAGEKKLRFYLDGNLVCEKDETEKNAFNLPGRPLYIGRDQFFKDKGFFRGMIDELTIFRGAKRSFSLDKRPSEPVAADSQSVYSPPPPKVEPPDPKVAESWKTLEKYNLRVVPAPKRIKVTGAAVSLTPDKWVIEANEKDIKAGTDLINSRIRLFGGKALEMSGSGPDKPNKIVIGNFDSLREPLSKVNIKDCPPEQGYVIESAGENGGTTFIVAGADRHGVLYGCVTLALLIKEGKDAPVIQPVSIRDWPDFKFRMSEFDLLPPSFNPELSKKMIDYVFLGKQNMMYVGAEWDELDNLIEKAPKKKEIFDYASARGVKCLWFQHAAVEKAPPFDPVKAPGYSYLYYPYKTSEGLMANSQYGKGRAYSWSRDDLIRKAAVKFTELLEKSGSDTLFLHAMDCGGRDNPENWNFRTPMDRDRWGDDRAAADAHLMNSIYSAAKNRVPSLTFIYVAYPYGTALLQCPELDKWIKRLSSLLDKDIYYCFRECLRDGAALWNGATAPHPNLIYHEGYPVPFRLFFSCQARYARTFYFEDRKKDIYWYGVNDNIGSVFRPQMMAAAEYSWNTAAPGWGWFPGGRNAAMLDERVPEITERLLPRALSIVYGEKAAPLIAKAFAENLSGNLAGDLSQFHGAPFLGYFKNKAEAAAGAVKNLEEAEPFVRTAALGDFKETLRLFKDIAKINKAKYLQLEARELLAENKFQEAENIIGEAAKALASVSPGYPSNAWAKPLVKDLDIARNIKWFKEKNDYLKNIKPLPLRIGVFTQGWYRGIIYGLNKSAGITASLFDDPQKDKLRGFDTIIFNACENTGDVYGDWRKNIREFAEAGGVVVFTHNAVGRYPSSGFGKQIFPEICAGFAGQQMDKPGLTVKKEIDGALKPGDKYLQEYFDHLTVKPGKDADVLIVNQLNEPVAVGGRVGKGYVIYTGEIFGLDRKNNDSDLKGDSWKALFHLIRHAKKQTDTHSGVN